MIDNFSNAQVVRKAVVATEAGVVASQHKRAAEVGAAVLAAGGDAVLFAHGHILRVLAARWVNLRPEGGSLLALDTATLSVLGFERETRVVRQWNEDAYLLPMPL